jgi:uncharacterized protein YceK
MSIRAGAIKTKEQAMPRLITLSIFTTVLLAGCVTSETRTASSKELAYCTKMENQMGIGNVHDHGETKGAGRSGMNISHDRCLQILSKPN